MKTRLISVILVVLLLVPAVTTPVVAQDGAPTPTTTPEEPTATPTDDSQDDEEQPKNQSDDQPSDTELLWQLIQESEDPRDDDPQQIVTSISPTFWVSDAEFNDDGTVTLTFVAELTTRVVITDATGFDRSAEVSRAESRGETIPRGTYQMTVPATVAADGNQAVTLSIGNGYIYRVSNGVVEEDSGWFEGRPLWEWFAYFAGVVLVGVVAHLVRRIWNMDHGAITTSEGAEIVGRLVAGMVDRPETDEDSAGDNE
jgi:hypothetical protein